MKKKKLIGMGLSTVVALTLVGCTSPEEPFLGDKVNPEKIQSEYEKVDTISKDEKGIEPSEQPKEPAQEPTEVLDATAVFTEIFKENERMLEEENFEGYMAMVEGTEEVNAMTAEVTKAMFREFDMDIEFSDVEIIEQTDTTAKVQVTQISKELSNSPDYKDNKTVAVHDFVLVDGEWKFASVEFKSVEFIE